MTDRLRDAAEAMPREVLAGGVPDEQAAVV
ncbi:hypothetical protein P3T25_002999 [Paraburkholderia sp. GAS32]